MIISPVIQKHYENAPITEGLIDIRVELPTDITLEKLKDIPASLEGKYQIIGDLGEAKVNLNLESGGPKASAENKNTGYLLRSIDEKRVFQFRLDGFTASRLAPYKTWEDLRDETKRMWDIYSSIAKPTKILRLAVRYINRLDIPIPFDDFKEYLGITPEVSSELPQALARFFMNLVIPFPEKNAWVIINQSNAPPFKPDTAAIILDIDVFREIELPPQENVQWQILEELRELKNIVFEGCITNKTRDLIR